MLPRYDGVLKHFKEQLQAQEEYEERRTAYVALTRARKRLFTTGAHWYGENINAKEGGKFLRELAGWVMDVRHGSWDPGEDIDEETNPLLGYRERFVKEWPEPARPDDSDEVFPDGWRHAALDAVAIGGVQPTLLEPLQPEERELFEELAAERRHHAGFLLEREGTDAVNGSTGPLARRTVSVGGVIDYARCPKRFYWTAVRPLPRFSGPAARIGTEVHRWIERRAIGQAVLLEVDETPDLTSEELAGEPGKVERLREAFLGSRFADVTPLHAERPFILRLDGFTVGGRIDAVYGEPDGAWEVVDWKTGRRPADDDPLAALQLDLYGLACVEIWAKRPEDVTLTYLYLASGEEVSHPMEDPEVVKARVVAALRSIDAGAFDPTPGPHCTYCDFRAFCSEGKAWLAAKEASAAVTS
jgi:DNA helicase-2/ATP-dependent DNA helicase PcrA